MNYTPTQQEAIRIIADKWMSYGRKAVVAVAGYAGTGKTTIVKEAVNLISKECRGMVRMRFACYTGKAASILRSKLHGEEVSTLHRLLFTTYPREYVESDAFKDDIPDDAIWTRDFVLFPNHDLYCDIVVVDEASMIPTDMWRRLTNHDVMLIVLGDPAQLPPVEDREDSEDDSSDGRYNPFDGKKEHEHYDVFLTEIMRQDSESDIISISMTARNHEELTWRSFSRGVGIYFAPQYLDGMVNDYIDSIRSSNDTIREALLCDNNSRRVMLNRYIHKALGFRTDSIEPGDRVICLRNSYIMSSSGNSIVNGTLGICSGVHTNEEGTGHSIDIISDGDVFSHVPLFMCDLAYALTVHKSQGSEWDKVYVIDACGNLWMNSINPPDGYNRWLYTAVTRARSELRIYRGKVKGWIEEKQLTAPPKQKQLTFTNNI